jgi:hypothetical protein
MDGKANAKSTNLVLKPHSDTQPIFGSILTSYRKHDGCR